MLTRVRKLGTFAKVWGRKSVSQLALVSHLSSWLDLASFATWLVAGSMLLFDILAKLGFVGRLAGWLDFGSNLVG